MWADAQCDGRALPNIGGALFSTPQRLADARSCSAVTLPIWENAKLGRKVNFALGKIPLGDHRAPKMYI